MSKGGEGKEKGRFNDYEDFRRLWGGGEIREIGFLRALEMQGDKISGGLCGHSLSAMIALLGA
ncbi:hypothetical protein [Bartonella sp. CL100XZDX]|uniref:hypothetical protein n=1 Tax=Bartonella sp. CL100XZDX TaxID=3243515 RepID=UPI0035CEC466